MNQRKAGVILSYIYLIVNTLVNLIYVPFLLEYMGKEEYGLYQLMGSLVAYISIMNLGLSTVITRFYSNYDTLDDDTGKENVLSISLIIYATLSLITIIIAGVLYSRFDYIFGHSLTQSELASAKQIFILLIFNLVVTLMSNIFDAVINSYERFFFLRMITILQIILQSIIVFNVMEFSPTAFSLVVVQSISLISVVILKIYYGFVKLQMKIKYHYFDHKLFKGMLTLCSSVFIVTIADQILWRSNQVILGIISGTAMVSIYAIGSQIYLSYMLISNTISGVFLPKITQMVARKEDNKSFSDMFIRIGRIQFLLLACVLSGFILFGKEFVTLWAGKEYLDAYWIAIIVMLPFTIDLIQNIGIVIMQAKNQYGFRAKVMILVALLNICAAIPLLDYFGGIGGAVATGFSIFIGNGLIMNWYFARKLKINIKRFWKEIGSIFIVVVICFLIGFFIINQLTVLNSGILELILKILIYLLLYCSLCWIFAMNKYERDLILKPVKSLLEKVK